MGEAFIPASDGRWVNENFMRLAEILHDYDSSIELRWIPPDQRTREDKKPYCVVHKQKDGKEYAILHASELDDPRKILAQVWSADNAKGDVLKQLENQEAAERAFELKKQMDIAEARRDFAAFLMGTKKNFIKTDNPVTGEKGMKLDSELRRRG
jgi:hypothetical protein